jgi:peptidyl-prolyl cis-trans isomerase A (cyclophilin A)
MLWETPVGYVIKGMDIVRKLNSSYGDMPPWGNGPEQPKIQFYGRRYIEEDFPNLDKFLKCVVQTI